MRIENLKNSIQISTSRISLLAPLYWLISSSIFWESQRTCSTCWNTSISEGLGIASVHRIVRVRVGWTPLRGFILSWTLENNFKKKNKYCSWLDDHSKTSADSWFLLFQEFYSKPSSKYGPWIDQKGSHQVPLSTRTYFRNRGINRISAQDWASRYCCPRAPIVSASCPLRHCYGTSARYSRRVHTRRVPDGRSNLNRVGHRPDFCRPPHSQVGWRQTKTECQNTQGLFRGRRDLWRKSSLD